MDQRQRLARKAGAAHARWNEDNWIHEGRPLAVEGARRRLYGALRHKLPIAQAQTVPGLEWHNKHEVDASRWPILN
jgi:hypothetical protein